MSKHDPISNPDEVPIETTRRVRDTCLCLHVQRAARAIARRYDEALRPLPLTSGQFSLMMSLNRPAPPAIGDVASVLAMDRTTVTANLKPLEKRGLVTISADRGDRRNRRPALTADGRRLLAAAMPLWEQAQAETEHLIKGLQSNLPTGAEAEAGGGDHGNGDHGNGDHGNGGHGNNGPANSDHGNSRSRGEGSEADRLRADLRALS